MEWVAPSYGAGDDGDALHTDRMTADERAMSFASCADIEKLLAAFLPRRDASVEQVFSHMKRRHEMRRRAIESHAKRNARAQFKLT